MLGGKETYRNTNREAVQRDGICELQINSLRWALWEATIVYG
jgi:hypothetical protein